MYNRMPDRVSLESNLDASLHVRMLHEHSLVAN